jgi:hypothetical protein
MMRHLEDVEAGSTISNVRLMCYPVEKSPWLRQIPLSVRLSSLQLQGLDVQLHPSNGFQGVLGAAVQVSGLKQLQLKQCTLLDEGDAALAQCASLFHLSISDSRYEFPTPVFQQLQQLTYLELARIGLKRPCQAGPVLEPLQR